MNAKSTLTTCGRIVLAEVDGDTRQSLATELTNANYSVIECHDGIELLDHIGTFADPEVPNEFDVIIADTRMPGVRGISILEALPGGQNAPPIILLLSEGDDEVRDEAQRLGVAGLFQKPFEIPELMARVKELFAETHDR